MAVLTSFGPLPQELNFEIVNKIGDDLHELGKNNGNPTIKDVLHEPGELTGIGDTKGNVADAIYDAGSIAKHTNTFVVDTADNLSHVSDQSLQKTADYFVRDFHIFLENVTHVTGLTYATHGITTLGSTIGFGNLGANTNLLDHTLNLATGRTSLDDSLTAISKDLTNISNAAPGPIDGLLKDLGPDSGGYSIGLLGPHGIVGGSGLDLAKLPDALSTDDGPLSPVSKLVDSISHATDGVGSASPGTLNIVTDALKLPGELLPDGGPTPSLTDAGHQLTTTLVATGDLLQGVLDGDTSHATADIGHIVSALGSFGDDAGPAVGIPDTLDSLVHGAGAVLGGDVSGGGANALPDLVGSIVADISHDVALAGIGSGDGPLGGGLPVGGLAGPVGDVVASIASLGGGGHPLDVLGGILSSEGGAGLAGGADLTHVGAVLDATPVGELLSGAADLDHLTSSLDLFGHGSLDVLHVLDHA